LLKRREGGEDDRPGCFGTGAEVEPEILKEPSDGSVRAEKEVMSS
jgi:hypothetical protein